MSGSRTHDPFPPVRPEKGNPPDERRHRLEDLGRLAATYGRDLNKALSPMALAAEARPGRGELILVVDDDPQVCALAAEVLERQGYATATAADGAEAVAIFATRRHEIRLVVTDMVIPKLDGVALARVVRYLNPGVPVLAMSGLVASLRGTDAASFGGALLFKPFQPRELLAAVEPLLGGTRRPS